MKPYESLLMKSHENLCDAAKELDAAYSRFRIAPNAENEAALHERGKVYATVQMESSGNFVDAVQGLPLGTTNARLDALEAKHTPQPLRLVLAAVADGATGIFAEMDGEM